MRPIKPEAINKRIRPSSFIEFFKNKYGTTQRANDQEIIEKLTRFYTDIAYGNFVDKDIEIIQNDPRIMQLATEECNIRVTKAFIYINALNSMNYLNNPYISMPEYQEVVDETYGKYYTYSIILKGLVDYNVSKNPLILKTLSAQFNSRGTTPMRRML